MSGRKSANIWSGFDTSTFRGDSPPRLVPMFPIGPLTPKSKCRHADDNLPAKPFYCVTCDRSWADGDGHPALRRDPKTDPRPEPAAKPEPATKPTPAATTETKPTRRQLRRMKFGRPKSEPCLV